MLFGQVRERHQGPSVVAVVEKDFHQVDVEVAVLVRAIGRQQALHAEGSLVGKSRGGLPVGVEELHVASLLFLRDRLHELQGLGPFAAGLQAVRLHGEHFGVGRMQLFGETHEVFGLVVHALPLVVLFDVHERRGVHVERMARSHVPFVFFYCCFEGRGH